MRYWGVLFIAVLFAACGLDKKSPSVIVYQASDYPASPLPSLSTVPLPIYFGFEELEVLIKEKLPVVLVNTPSIKKGSLKGASLRIIRKNDIKLIEKDNQLFINLKLKIEMKPLITRHVMGRDVTMSPKIDAIVDVDLQTPLDLNEDYQLLTQFKLTRLDYIEEPEAHVLFMAIPVRSAVDSVLNEHTDMIEKTIDGVIKQYVKLQKPIDRIWSKLHRPIRINKNVSEVYIQALPQSLAVSSIAITEDGIWVQTRLSAYLETRLAGDTMPREIVPLPRLVKLDTIDNTFDMRFRVVIPLAKVNEVLNSSYVRKPLKSKLSVVSIEWLKLQTTPEGLLLFAQIAEPTRADLYFKGGLSFHAPDTALIASDISFELDEGGMLVAAADAILHERVMEAIGKELQIPLGNLMNHLEPLVENAIQNGKIGKSIALDLSDILLKPSEIGYRPDSIVVEVRATGQAALQILQFKKQPKGQ